MCIRDSLLVVDPISLIRFPNIKNPIKGVEEGTINDTTIVITIGNIILIFDKFFISLELGNFSSCSFILIKISLLVTVNFTIKGIITGTNAIYEYAAIAIGPNKWGARTIEVYIAVGPSAPPIIAKEAASWFEKPIKLAIIRTEKIPICAAAPKNTSRKFYNIGPKSVRAPTPIKISGGKNPVLIRA